MPKAHRDTMEVLFVFLKWVASFAHLDEETGSKMDLSNLATVITPSILYSRSRDATREDSFGTIRVITTLLENQDEFFTVPEEFLPILQDQEYFANSLELPGKDFLKKCDTYQKIKSGNVRTPGTPFTGPNGTPRLPPGSPQVERPPLGPLIAPTDRMRGHPGMPPPGNGPYPGPLSNNSHSQAPIDPRGPPPEDRTPQPRSSSRPPSFVQSRPSTEHPFPPATQNGYIVP